jgi:hypothetical protein
MELKATEYNLRHSFFMASVKNLEGMQLGHLRINLYLLATGPYHQDFALPLPKAP